MEFITGGRMKFKIKDLQNTKENKYLWDGKIFKTEEEGREALITFHDIDRETEIKDFSLKDLCEFGEWEIEEVKE